MPEMDGIEAVELIRGMGYKSPIVALTANALVGQAEEFMRNGFDGFLSKPIQTVHLNAVLRRFIKEKYHPSEKSENTDGIDEYFSDFMQDSGINDELCIKFAQDKMDALREITDAIDASDVKTAHRLAHSLKGLAGIIGENTLMDAAEKVEILLRQSKDSETDGLKNSFEINALGIELEKVLSEIKTRYPLNFNAPTQKVENVDIVKVKDVLDRMKPLLEQRNADVVALSGELAGIPLTAEVVRHVGNFDFALALEELLKVREGL